jgi:hypothetical protein
LKSTKLFEKIEIEWFCEDELKSRMSEYRPFYREVVGSLLQKMHEIRKFIAKHPKSKRTTRKAKSITRTQKNKRKMRGG